MHTNANNKQYANRYTLLIVINKNDKKGELLRRLAEGTVVEFAEFSLASVARKCFMECAGELLKSNYGGQNNFSVYGLTCIVDNADCVQYDAEVIPG